MAGLGTLPAELAELVAGFLPPLDALSLALTCKDKRQQCEKILRGHAGLSEIFREVRLNPLNEDIGDLADPENDATNEDAWEESAWGIFYKICYDSRIAYHIKEVRNTEDDSWLGEFRPSDEQRARCHAAAERAEALVGIEPAEIREAIDDQYDSKMACILMQMCPDIHTLQFADFVTDDVDHIEEFLARVADRPDTVRPGTLQKVRTAIIQHGDTEYSINIDWAVSVARLPSMRTIKGHMVGPGAEPNQLSRRTSSMLPVSNITTLNFTYCSIDVPGWVALLPQIKALEVFAYDEGGAVVSLDCQPDFCAMVALLAKYHGHSLRSLEITDSDGIGWVENDEDMVPFPGFQSFKKLEDLTVPARIFFIRRDPEKVELMLKEIVQRHVEQGSAPEAVGTGQIDEEEEDDDMASDDAGSDDDEDEVNDNEAEVDGDEAEVDSNEAGSDHDEADPNNDAPGSDGQMLISDNDEADSDDGGDDYFLELNEVEQIGHELPQSLKHLQLQWLRNEPFDATNGILTRLVVEKDRHHPHLQALSIPPNQHEAAESDRKMLAAACKEHGIKLNYGWDEIHSANTGGD